MPYADLATIQATNPGDPLTAAWCDQVRDNEEFFVDPPVASVYNSAPVSVPNATETTLNANSESFDNDSMHSTGSNTSRLTIQTAGRYLFLATVQFAADADLQRNVKFRVDGTTSYEAIQVVSSLAGNSVVLPGIRCLSLAAGQYVETRVIQQAGSALDVTLLEFVAIFLTR